MGRNKFASRFFSALTQHRSAVCDLALCRRRRRRHCHRLAPPYIRIALGCRGSS